MVPVRVLSKDKVLRRVLRRELFVEDADKVLRRKKHVLSQSMTLCMHPNSIGRRKGRSSNDGSGLPPPRKILRNLWGPAGVRPVQFWESLTGGLANGGVRYTIAYDCGHSVTKVPPGKGPKRP